MSQPKCLEEWTKLKESALSGDITTEILLSMGLGRWNDPNDGFEEECVFGGHTLWLIPADWEIPLGFDFVDIFGEVVNLKAEEPKDSRLGYLAFGVIQKTEGQS